MTKREWLRVLPYLKLEDQHRLELVLLGESNDAPPAPTAAEHDC
jgi:hypothetical protein